MVLPNELYVGTTRTEWLHVQKKKMSDPTTTKKHDAVVVQPWQEPCFAVWEDVITCLQPSYPMIATRLLQDKKCRKTILTDHKSQWGRGRCFPVYWFQSKLEFPSRTGWLQQEKALWNWKLLHSSSTSQTITLMKRDLWSAHMIKESHDTGQASSCWLRFQSPVFMTRAISKSH